MNPGSQMLDLSGRVALVTGAASGLGAEMSRMLAAAGASVVVGDLSETEAAKTAADIEKSGGTAIAVALNVTDIDSIKSAFEAAQKAYGRFDILINNAGIYPPYRLAELTTETFDRTQAINLRGPFLCIKEAMNWIGDDGGVILNIASIDALRVSFQGLAHYGSSKAGLIGLTKHCAVELGARNIRVNAILPGGVGTPGAESVLAMMDESQLADASRAPPLGRGCTPGDIASAALFLASDGASFITGQTLVVDGGISVLG